MDIYLIGSAYNGEFIAPEGAHVAVFNSAYQRYPHADFMFFQDAHFWDTLKDDDLRKFAGRILSILPTDNPRVERLTASDITIGKGKKRFTAMGKNSGFHAICWAINQGYSRIFLLGFECKYYKGCATMPEVFAMWQAQHKELAALNPPITNLTPDSGIDAYQTVTDGE